MNPQERAALAAEILESNKRPAALIRDAEQAIAARQGPLPLDLRALPQEQWTEDAEVALPPDVQAFLAGHDGTPLPVETVHALEIAVEKYHGVAEPWGIAAGPLLQQTGRGWRYIAGTAPYLTGFHLVRIDR